MEREKEHTLTLMNEGIFPDNDKMCFRGLESELQEVMEHRKYVITAVKAAVLRDGQGGKRLSKPKEMKKLRCKLVTQSQDAATFAALWDAKNCYNVM